MITEHTNSAQIVAEIAARYGAIIATDCKVQVAPTGYAATATEYVWNGYQLEPVDKEAAQNTWRKANAAKAKRDMAARDRRAKIEKTQERIEAEEAAKRQAAAIRAQDRTDARVKAAQVKIEAIREYAATRTARDVAAHMGITEHAARKYMLKFKISYVYRTNTSYRQPDIERAKAYAARLAAGETVQQIADAEGRRPKSVYELMRRNKVLPPVQKAERVNRPEPKVLRREAEERIAKRQVKVRALVNKGLNSQQIAAALSVNIRIVQNDRASMGISAPSGYIRYGAREAVSARRQEVLRLRSEGKSRREIAEALGVSQASISKDMQELGISFPSTGNIIGNPDTVSRVLAMRVQKMSLRQIADTMSLAASTVSRIFKQARAA